MENVLAYHFAILKTIHYCCRNSRGHLDFCSFDLVFLLTNGGPADETLTLSLYIYKMAFPAKDSGIWYCSFCNYVYSFDNFYGFVFQGSGGEAGL